MIEGLELHAKFLHDSSHDLYKGCLINSLLLIVWNQFRFIHLSNLMQ